MIQAGFDPGVALIQAGPGHAVAMAAIHAACFHGPEAWDAAAMATLLAMPGCTGLIHPVGGLILLRTAADEAEILTLAVHPEARRRGVGHALLTSGLALSDAAAVFLEVAAANLPALALYYAAGFSQCGLRRRYYADGDDALVLRRLLNGAGSSPL